jgi:two-component system, LytTR family, sensor kinase
MNKYIEIFFHVLFWALTTWIVYLTFGSAEFEMQNINGVVSSTVRRNPMELWTFVMGAGFKATLFYINAYYFFPIFTKNKNVFKLFAKLFVSVSLLLLAEILLFNYFVLDSRLFSLFNTPRFSINLTIYFFYIGISFAYCFSKSWIKNEKQKAVLIEEKLSTELNFLKAQVNPHFLFNTLNNLYSMANKSDTPELAEGISKLSNLMRYMLYDSNHDKVPLKSEVDYIQSFIEIQKLRLSEEDDFLIHFNIEGDTDHILIAPMLLIPFVENAFKHGINFKESSIIKIELKIADSQLIFSVFNSNYKADNEIEKGKSGIGLNNLKRRLALLYPDSHSLDIKEEDEVHGAILKLNLT